jgi:hypothetical protein
LAAVQAAAGGRLTDLEHDGGRIGNSGPAAQRYGAGSPAGSEPGGGARGTARSAGGGGEFSRAAERLHTIHSSGEVVPLPFLQTTDLAPLALAGLHRSPAALVWPHLAGGGGGGGGGLDWQGALRDVLLAAQAGESSESDGAGQALVGGQLSPALAARIAGSPVLLSLASALAAHKAVLAEQQELGAPLRVQEPTKYKADVLADTLRAILCL